MATRGFDSPGHQQPAGFPGQDPAPAALADGQVPSADPTLSPPPAGAAAQVPPAWPAAAPERPWNAAHAAPDGAVPGHHGPAPHPAARPAAPDPAATYPGVPPHVPRAPFPQPSHAQPTCPPAQEHQAAGGWSQPAAAAPAGGAAGARPEAVPPGPEGTTAPPPRRPGLVATLTGWAGAVTSLTLVAGLGLWGYQIVMRDVSDVPVIRAMSGDYRVRPADPGGEIAPNRGLAVNRVQSGGGVAEPPETVVLAPDPLPLAPEDAPVLRVADAEGAPRPRPRATLAESPPTAIEDVAYQPAAPTPEQTRATINALVAQVVAARPTPEEARRLARLPGVKRSPRPRPRPARRVAALPPNALADGTAPGTPPPAAAPDQMDDLKPVPPGTHLVQLGAFDSIEQARAAWDALLDRHADLMGGRRRVIERAESGGRPFYRLRMTGFDSRADARRFCSALLARNTACVYTTAR